ncbi:ariadne RING finger [Westerdykella ornata]|uniref:RBR-type E3 ubiquitin transferase n=1 Tax=Westerdykella ornata TaxID=318751 RepID=A0A6A6JGP6_WESOR|nr:ariadne RING finger [Westerdykella ornata]KAF2274806.1 ariadne RING finger [Westerdykella ornata]
MATDDPELENPPPGVVERPRAVLIEDDLSRKVSALIIADDSLYSDPSIEGESSIPHVESQAQALKHLSQNRFECCTCTERYRWDKITQLACGDYYCTPCLRRVILRAVTERDLTYLPPRCCRTSIPREIIETLLSAEEKSEFRLAELEKDTVDKTYCSGSQCGKFIPPSDIYAGEAKCYACGATTCSLCKNSSHQSDCPKDQALQATLELAVAQHWQRCYSCKALVEIKHGCNHITCRCGAEFCYLCGASWRTCRCQLFTEANLLRRAAQVVDRVAPAALHAQERQRQIARMQHNLRTAEECDHSGGYRNFEQIEGDREQPFRCDMCDAQHWLFILRCRRCHIDICVRCRHNRI